MQPSFTADVINIVSVITAKLLKVKRSRQHESNLSLCFGRSPPGLVFLAEPLVPVKPKAEVF